MTIKEIEQQVGITKANIRFYEAEGLLNPGRSANNYREYTQNDVEQLEKIKCLRTLGLSVSDIRRSMNGECSMEEIMNERVREIQMELEELSVVQSICQDFREQQVQFGTLDPAALSVKMELLKKRERQAVSRDEKDRFNQWRKIAWTWCLICMASIVMIPINIILNIKIPEMAVNVYILIVLLSPLPFYAVSYIMGKSPLDDNDLYNWGWGSGWGWRIVPDTRLWKGIERFHQICLTTLIVIPLNQILKVQWPVWLTVLWVAVMFGSTIAVLVVRNRKI